MIEKAHKKKKKYGGKIRKHKSLPVGDTEFAPIAANVTRFCMFTEFTTENNESIIKKKKKNTNYTSGWVTELFKPSNVSNFKKFKQFEDREKIKFEHKQFEFNI